MTGKAAARRATTELGAWVSTVDITSVPGPVLARLSLILLDVFGVTAIGANLAEHRALRSAWTASPGPAPLFGAGQTTTVDAAATLNALALVALELDEGNKYARGHPTAHGFPAVLALAAERNAGGADTAAALLAAYEVAARFGRATRLAAGSHPHGNWGVAGAAAGCARLLGLDPDACAAAIDTGAGLAVAGHFDSALDGNPVRDAWMAAANTSGLLAARMAAAGLARNTGTAALSLGTLLGELAPAELTAGLGTRWDITTGYFKRHASCSFTHPAADAVLATMAETGLDPGRIAAITVETHALGLGLSSTAYDNRLSGMFSTPFVVATAVRHGRIGPEATGADRIADPDLRALAERVRVVPAADLDARLPAQRAARITIELADGTAHRREVPNPVGDADHQPLDEAGLLAVLGGWLPATGYLDRAAATARTLPGAAAVGAPLRALADLHPHRQGDA
jgi:2-methylcitrate dehydratase PrpD